MWDDLKNIKPLPRLFSFPCSYYICHFLFILTNRQYFIDNKNILFIFNVFLIFGIVWFINAFNFMDGINGIPQYRLFQYV